MRFFIFFSIVLGIWLLEHLYVGWRLQALPFFSAPGARRWLFIGLAIGFASYPLGRILFHNGWTTIGWMLEYVGAVWMGTLFLLIPALAVVDAVTLFGLVLKPWVFPLRTAATLVALALAAVAWVGGVIMPRTVEMEVELPRLPAASDGTVVVHLSDIHLGTLIGKRRLQALIDRVETMHPDLVAVTGDLVDGDAGLVETLVPQLKAMTAPLGVFAILGNHEMYAGAERSTALLQDAGYTVLDGDAVEVAPGLWVVGIPDARGSRQTGQGRVDLEKALDGVGEGAVILLQHAPENHENAAAAGVGLMLDGHTHGAQIWPAHYLVRRAFPHLAGTYQVGNMTQVISRGAGQWGPPMRLFARSEIIRITLRSPAVAD